MNALGNSPFWRLALATFLIGSALAGCAGPQRNGPESVSPRGAGPGGTAGERASATWAADHSWAVDLSATERKVFVTTYGSSSCPATIAVVQMVEPDNLAITVEVGQVRDVCSADMAPHTSSADVPEGVFTEPVVKIALEGNPVVITLHR
ncbi:hypothetical protein [Arthrobacter sp. 35W]|uniref:hypothetical protein n=1 Tax=Arthrobacter sp. 35W TaxID=1132441 RepID=UPI00047D6D0D|nr:hypothetical protein [Arthrobacter sp. 35W]